MKKFILICLLLFTTGFCFAQGRDAILKVLHDQQDAWNRADIEGFMQGYWKSDSVMFITGKPPVYGWQKMLERYKKAYPGKAGMGQLTFNIIQVKVLDATNGFVMGGWRLKLENGKTPGGYYTLWFKKINGEWKIVCDHTS
jgi:ketosteroid isomerase-like protein